jgi:hypothetical protein
MSIPGFVFDLMKDPLIWQTGHLAQKSKLSGPPPNTLCIPRLPLHLCIVEARYRSNPKKLKQSNPKKTENPNPENPILTYDKALLDGCRKVAVLVTALISGIFD